MYRHLSIAMSIIIAGANVSFADVNGEWVMTSKECQYASGERDQVRISGNEISGLEWSCEVQGRSYKNGYTFAKALCGAEGEDIRTTLKYKLDGNGLHFKWGKQAEKLYRYQCN